MTGKDELDGHEEPKRAFPPGAGFGIGLGVGVALAAATDSPVWIALGVVFGAAFARGAGRET